MFFNLLLLICKKGLDEAGRVCAIQHWRSYKSKEHLEICVNSGVSELEQTTLVPQCCLRSIFKMKEGGKKMKMKMGEGVPHFVIDFIVLLLLKYLVCQNLMHLSLQHFSMKDALSVSRHHIMIPDGLLKACSKHILWGLLISFL